MKNKGSNTYDAKQLEQEAIKLIEKHNLVFIDDVCAYLPCSRATFYNKGLDKLDSIKDALTKMRTAKKIKLRKNWESSKSAVLQMGLYKLLATDEELKKLSMQQVDHTTGGDKLPTTIIQFIGDSDNENTD